MITLYDYLPSQNAYKVRLLLSHLQQPYRTKFVSIFEGEGQRAEYLRINPTGAVPAIELEDGRVLAESNAILWFLASGTPYLPDDLFAQAKVLQWLSFEGDYVQSTVATLRHWVMTGKAARRPEMLVASKRQGSLKCLGVLDRHLGDKRLSGRRCLYDRRHFRVCLCAPRRRGRPAAGGLSQRRRLDRSHPRATALPCRTIPVFDRSALRETAVSCAWIAVCAATSCWPVELDPKILKACGCSDGGEFA